MKKMNQTTLFIHHNLYKMEPKITLILRKRLMIVIILTNCLFSSFSQPSWVTFTNSNPSEPIFTLQSSSNSEVVYNVEVPGMYQESVHNDTVIYQRISLPKATVWGNPGDPEIPAVVKYFAIPQCNAFTITVVPLDSVVLSDYMVYPQPELVEDTASGHLEEVFVKNDSVYALNIFLPENNEKVIEEGFLRNQRTLRLATYPIKYNPDTKQLVAYTHYTLTMTFTSATSALNNENGLFNGLTKSVVMNYNIDRAAPPPPLPTAQVQWITLNDTSEAKNIIADYLIITAHQFFSPASQSLAEFALHRSVTSGYCVGIVDVTNIVNLPFKYDLVDPFENEQKIRSFIKRVYEGAHAQHTVDGRVAFVLLVGDAQENIISDLWVPTSLDPDPTGQWDNSTLNHYSDNDYYYSCVTKTTAGDFDMTPDLFIGRFSVDDETELHNIVKKTKDYENEIWSGVSNGEWRKKNLLAYGLAGQSEYTQYFCTDLVDWLNELLPPDPPAPTESLDGTNNDNWNQDYVDLLNNQGCNLVIDYGHGTQDVWCLLGYQNENQGALTLDFKESNLQNTGMYPFAIAQACNTAKFDYDGSSTGHDCIAEDITVYSDSAGYVASLGSWPTVDLNYYTNKGEFPKFIYEAIPYALFNNASALLGECVLEGGLLSINTDHWPFQNILFGDPALNLLAQGYELTHNVHHSGTLKISTPTYIRSNATLTLSNNSVVDFENNGQLIVEGKLVLGANVQFYGRNMDNLVRVTGVIEGAVMGPNPPNPVPIINLTCNAAQGADWKGFEFNNPSLSVKLEGGSISNCQITGSLASLEIDGTSSQAEFNASRIEMDGTNLAIRYTNCTNTDVLLYNYQELPVSTIIEYSDFVNCPNDLMIGIDHYPEYAVENNNIQYQRGTGLSVSYCGGASGNHTILNNTIEKSGSSAESSWGIRIYNSFADVSGKNYITNNKYGISCMNQSSVTILGDQGASSESNAQRIMSNYLNQIKCYDNSFPYELHYNVIKNNSNPSNALIYYDRSQTNEQDPPLPDGSLDVKCNCFPANPVFFPANGYTYTPGWCPPANCNSGSPGKDLYEQAIVSADSSDFILAESTLMQVVQSNPGTAYARESAKSLVSVKKSAGGDFNGLKNYFDTAAGLVQDSLAQNLVYRLKNRCSVESGAFEQAVTWYENDILNPSSMADSVYSLVDLADTYLLMSADSGSKGPNHSYTGSLVQYKPENKKQYRQSREKWIRLLFDEKKTEGQDQPGDPAENNKQNFRFINQNPFHSVTTIEFDLNEVSDIKIIVSSVDGQLLRKIEKSRLNLGKHVEKIDLSDVPDGVYLFSLFINNSKAGTIKGIKMR